jgi:hypothetical protein
MPNSMTLSKALGSGIGGATVSRLDLSARPSE